MGLLTRGHTARKEKARKGLLPMRARRTSTNTNGAAKPKRKVDVGNVIIISVMVVGACIVAYPTVSDWWNNYHQYRLVTDYMAAVDDLDSKEIERMLEAARAYNEHLLTTSNRYNLSDAERAEYESLLNVSGNGMIGYLQINSIHVNLPIYHGVSQDVLQRAIGHIEGSSLPIGGPSTHCAVSGHRGLPSAKLFSDLDRLTEGDTFTVTVLNQTITYEVDKIHIVDPTDMRDLDIVMGMDYMTLVTCTPYGVNTHRLLVRGHRIDNLAGTLAVPAEAVQIPNYIAVPAVAVPMLFTYLVGALVYYSRFGRYNRRRVMEELSDIAGVELPEEVLDPTSIDDLELPERLRPAASGSDATPDAPTQEG